MPGNSLIISAYGIQQPDEIWLLLLITAAVLAGFFMMFRRIVDRYGIPFRFVGGFFSFSCWDLESHSSIFRKSHLSSVPN